MTPHDFVAKWRASALKERSASQEHFIDLCRLVGEPTPAEADPSGETYCFERGARKDSGGDGWADVWKRHHFAWEYKGRHADLDKAFGQLRQYALALENPPLLVVCDMERFRIRTNWTNSVSRTHEFGLDDLADAATRNLLKWTFADPGRLRPGETRQSLTEKAASSFAALASALRGRGHEPHAVAHFVNRLVFCMFADDTGLLPDHMFTRMLKQARRAPEHFIELASALFKVMASGGRVGFEPVAWFNGGLFDDAAALPLDKADIDTVLAAADLDWSEIDPSILGTLFERGLDPGKRAQLGAHYTDRDKIMLIVEPVVVRPWLAAWAEEKAAIAAELAKADAAGAPATRTKRRNEAERRLRAFLDRLRRFTVLDPACGSGNFLYLALQALKDIEHRVQFEAEALGFQRGFPEIGPANVRGIEINPYAAELARVSVWIGEIQWMRRNGFAEARDPILRPLDTIECRDAILMPAAGEAARASGSGGDGGGGAPSAAGGVVDAVGVDAAAAVVEGASALVRTPAAGSGGAGSAVAMPGGGPAHLPGPDGDRDVAAARMASGAPARGDGDPDSAIVTPASGEPVRPAEQGRDRGSGAAVVAADAAQGGRPAGLDRDSDAVVGSASAPGGSGDGDRDSDSAIVTPAGREPEWPEADVIIGNPPFLGAWLQFRKLGDDYVSLLRKTYQDRVPGGADLVCYWFEKAGRQIASGKAARAGLVATNSIRGGWNLPALQAATASHRIFEAWSDEPWINDGASVRVSLVCFSSREDATAVTRPCLDGRPTDEIYSDLTARGDSANADITGARRLPPHAAVVFMGDKKTGHFDITGDQARTWLRLPANPNGRTNADVLKPWMNGMDVTRRPAGKWIIDFGWTMSETEAALYEEPFAHVAHHVKSSRQGNRVQSLREFWWRHERPRPGMWGALEDLSRYIATPTVAKHRLFVWCDVRICPDHQLIVIARDDDTTFGILHSRFHELWSLRLGTSLEDRPRYTPSTTFETFPFPDGLGPDASAAASPGDAPADNHMSPDGRSPDAPAASIPSGAPADGRTLPDGRSADTPAATSCGTPAAGRTHPAGRSPDTSAAGYADDPRAIAIAEAARRLVALRDRWLNPPEWVEWVDEPVPGYPPRPVPRDDDAAKALKKRTLTNLYNARPQWLADAHAALDAAVANAYGWPPDIAADDFLADLLARNRRAAAAEPAAAPRAPAASTPTPAPAQPKKETPE